jgi:hypothetical protein
MIHQLLIYILKIKNIFEKNFKYEYNNLYKLYFITPLNKVDKYTYLVDGEEFSLYEDLYLIKDGKMI